MRCRAYQYLLALWLTGFLSGTAFAQWPDALRPFNKPEEYTIRSRVPEDLRNLPGPLPTAPPTVSVPHPDATEVRLTLDDAIRQALENSEVIRVLAGNGAVSTGQTIYTPAIAHTAIDSALGQFDPVLSANNVYNRTSTPVPNPITGGFDSLTSNVNSFDVGVSQTNLAGGVAALQFTDIWSRTGPRGVLNPQNQPALLASYTQPLLAGAGVCANRVPIVLARIQTEQSFFRFKGAYQQTVSSVISGYWNLVFARTDLWAREQQVELAKFLYEQAEARKRAGFDDAGSVAQRRVALANFRASLIAARASVLDAEAAIKNVLGVPPNDGIRLIPVTPPTREEIDFNWEELILTALTYRPDLVELKLVLDADDQQHILAANQAQPRLDLSGSYRWNGLSGQLPSGQGINTGLNQSGDYTFGVNFSVPLRLRAARANLRGVELLIAQDRANLRQGQHAATHEIATTLRAMASTYQQYEAFIETREAALENLKQLAAQQLSGLANFQVVLQGISDWGNAVSAEAQALTVYNSQLAQLEEQTGTILDTHGVRFYEERYSSLGPKKHGPCCDYPKSLRPNQNQIRYEFGDEPAERFFNLDEYPQRRSGSSEDDDDDDWDEDDDTDRRSGDDDKWELDDESDRDRRREYEEPERRRAPGGDDEPELEIPKLRVFKRRTALPAPVLPKWKSVYDR